MLSTLQRRKKTHRVDHATEIEFELDRQGAVRGGVKREGRGGIWLCRGKLPHMNRGEASEWVFVGGLRRTVRRLGWWHGGGDDDAPGDIR